MSQNEKLVKWDERKKQFTAVASVGEALFSWKTAPEGWYIVLKNPAEDLNKEHPTEGTKGETKLKAGRKINIHGPANFALWPGQMARIIQGHRLRNNQYLVARVYNEEAANKYKDESKVETAHTEIESEQERNITPDIYPERFKMGELLIIKGTAVGFYMPPTGIEIVAETRGENPKYVREAVTLERLEYCILLDQNGNKRYVQGPDVVFPNSTETFVSEGGKRKFRAMELNDQMGIYVKVIETYQDEDKTINQGDELFITGKETRIYFPRREHSIIRYGEKDRHYATIIPDGEARYVLDKETGAIELAKGPKTFLPDPRRFVIVRRVLTPNLVEMLFPNNSEAKEHNESLSSVQNDSDSNLGSFASNYLSDNSARSRSRGMMLRSSVAAPASANVVVGTQDQSQWTQESAGTTHLPDSMARGSGYTPPRTITLDTKYDGAVSIQVWSGYAMLLTSKSGNRRVIMGPQTVLLSYDEVPEVFTLSKGMPKGSKGKKQDVFLRVHNNRVSDSIDAVTKDFVDVIIKLAFRVNFTDEGENFKPENWFSVENYTQLLSDHMGSIVRNAVKKYGIEKFNNDSIDIIRNTILGDKPENDSRPGKFFMENNMRVYDVEVLGIEIEDSVISEMLHKTQREAVQSAIHIATQERNLAVTKRNEEIVRETEQAKSMTIMVRQELQLAHIVADLKVGKSKIESEIAIKAIANTGEMAHQLALNEKHAFSLGREKSTTEQQNAFADAEQARQIDMLQAETNAWVDRAKAVDPEFKAQLKLFGERIFTSSLVEQLGAHAMLKGNSVADVFSQLVASSPGLAKVMENIPAMAHTLKEGEIPETVVTGTGTAGKKKK
jgi:major vault protein